jgi:BNR repeat-containing family member
MVSRNANSFLTIFILAVPFFLSAQETLNKTITIVNVDSGWAGNSINTVIFRKNSIASYKNYQFISYYDKNGFVVIGKRKISSKNWELKKTQYKGNIKDAHNSISISVDGDGYLHIAWDHHNHPLRYCKSKTPLSLELTERQLMVGDIENKISYPEFYNTPGGGLLFFYRDGSSGNGNLVINKYDLKTKSWKRLQSNLIDGEGKRNAYWQACVDAKGIIHLSWVWRESPDVASNHDICYARSADNGITWEKSDGEKYVLPITASTAEYIHRIPPASELINQTSMCADAEGNPYIASYWRPEGSAIPQYHIIYKKENKWVVQSAGFRKTPFTLSGGGTKQIPISRPQVIVWGEKKNFAAALIFRDAERNNLVSVAVNKNLKTNNNWELYDLTSTPVGAWEPSYDTELWKEKKELHLFVQQVMQADAEGITDFAPQMVQVAEWKPFKK